MAEVKPYRRLNKFELHQLIGEGAMGVVWKAYDTELRRYVALKLLSTRIGETREMRDRFLREARTAGGIQHPNIVTVYDLGEAEDQLYIAMELVEGRDLSDLITLREPLPLERKLDIVIELLAGLDFAHQRGIIHRDIKPANIRLQPDGRVKIMDFGIARLQSADHTGSGAIVGTPTYMAPEQITNGAITPATDLFSVGCVLYELLTYQKPFEGETIHGVLYRVLTTDPTPLRAMAPSIPASLERVVTKAMSKAPGDRYDKARTMQQQISGIRSALSGGTDQTTQRLAPAWLRLPNSVLGLVRHTALPARLAALGGLIVVSLMLLWTSFRSNADEVASPPASAARAPTPGTVPTHLNPAVAALRDSAFAAQARAQQVGAMKNNVAAAPLAETLLETGERAASAGEEVRATSRYTSAIAQYRVAVRETDSLRADTKQRLDRTTPLVTAPGTRPSA